MATRVAFLWSGIQGAYLGGWSENFWHPGTPVQALADAKRLKVKLMPCHSNQSKLTHIRCTPTDVTVAPVLFALAPPEIGTNIGREFGLNVMADAMLLEMRNSGTNEHTRQWIKGIPDGFVEQGRISVDGVIREQIRALTDALSAAPWSMYKQVPTAPQKIITAFNLTTGVVTSPAHGYAEQTQIKILRAKNTTKLNGTWKVMTVTTNTFKLQGYNPELHIGDYIPGSGVARQVVLGIVACDAARILRATKHSVGRPFGLYRGRRTPVRN